MNWGTRASFCAPSSLKSAKQSASLNISRQLPNEMLISPESHFAYKTLSDPLKLAKVFPVQKTLWHCQNKCSRIFKTLPNMYVTPISRIISVNAGWPLKKSVRYKEFFYTLMISSFSISFSVLWIPRYISSFAFWNGSLEENQSHEEDVNEGKSAI